MLILDTDAASVLAKGDLLGDTLKLFEEVYITPKVETELEKPLEYGYDYPQEVFNQVETLNIRKEEKEKYREWFKSSRVDKGEIEATAVAENREAILFTMDKKAKEFSAEKGVQNLSLNNLIKILFKRDIRTREKLKTSIDKIEEKDNREINKQRILKELEQ